MTDQRPPHATIEEMEGGAYSTIEELEAAHATADLDSPSDGVRFADVNQPFDELHVTPDQLGRIVADEPRS